MPLAGIVLVTDGADNATDEPSAVLADGRPVRARRLLVATGLVDELPDVPGLRPTPDRVRETLFNWLGQDLTGWRVLDAFAGSGALGFEAASRGALNAIFYGKGEVCAALGVSRSPVSEAVARHGGQRSPVQKTIALGVIKVAVEQRVEQVAERRHGAHVGLVLHRDRPVQPVQHDPDRHGGVGRRHVLGAHQRRKGGRQPLAVRPAGGPDGGDLDGVRRQRRDRLPGAGLRGCVGSRRVQNAPM